MKTKLLFLNFLLLSSLIAFSQATVPTNTRTLPLQFLGWGGGLAGPLEIRNDFNQPITFHTNGTQRMRITQNNVKQKTVK